MKQYAVIRYWSDEDSCFVADVPELSGCAANGPTQALALANAQDSMQFWIESAKGFGDPVPEPKVRRLVFA